MNDPGHGAGPVDGADAVDDAATPDSEPAAEEPASAFEPTGAEAVDQVLANLGSLDGLAPQEQVPQYDEAHRRLHEILTGADELDDLEAGADDDSVPARPAEPDRSADDSGG